MKDCNNCRCKPICKETEAWQEYIKQHLEMRKKSSLFDADPECPYYIAKEKEEVHMVAKVKKADEKNEKLQGEFDDEIAKLINRLYNDVKTKPLYKFNRI